MPPTVSVGGFIVQHRDSKVVYVRQRNRDVRPRKIAISPPKNATSRPRVSKTKKGGIVGKEKRISLSRESLEDGGCSQDEVDSRTSQHAGGEQGRRRRAEAAVAENEIHGTLRCVHAAVRMRSEREVLLQVLTAGRGHRKVWLKEKKDKSRASRNASRTESWIERRGPLTRMYRKLREKMSTNADLVRAGAHITSSSTNSNCGVPYVECEGGEYKRRARALELCAHARDQAHGVPRRREETVRCLGCLSPLSTILSWSFGGGGGTTTGGGKGHGVVRRQGGGEESDGDGQGYQAYICRRRRWDRASGRAPRAGPSS
ncbi:hypothetical protein C8R44DRAFT_747118 [Mycena epipterygia]|nr:hypothetical protein C8R44DRAFT_747118 [Mycena epipterygia]